jgi:glycerate 2-kinase
MSHEIPLRRHADELRRAALEAVEPAAAIRRHVQRTGDTLLVAGRPYDLARFEHVYLVAGGKAALPMAAAAAALLGDRLTEGVVVTKYGHGQATGHRLPPCLTLLEAGHPLPDANSVRGAEAITAIARRAGAHDLVLCLLSGGGSALLTLPVAEMSLEDMQALTDDLLRSGATIQELNTVRKHLSQIAGGQLARLAAPAALVTLVLSDVIGDPLDVIASGPTVPDPTTVAEAQAVLARRSVRRSLPLRETPKPGDPAFARVEHVIIGSNRLAALAALERARALGYRSLLLGTYLEGEAREVGRVAAALAKGVLAHGDPLAPPACLIWGGETTVTVRGAGRGGRNQELALGAALALDGWQGALVMALATDGSDGPTDAAGAIATGETLARARTLGLDPHAALAENDSYTFFAALDDLLRTGPTGTNVNDLLFILTAAD